MKKEIEIQRIRKRYLKEIVCQSRKWLVMAGIAMLILSIYNIVISWLLQTIIDIVSGDSSMTILQVGIIAMITFLIFIAAYVIYRVARPKYLYQAMLCYKQKIFCKIIYVFLTIFLYLLKCPQSLILSALRAFCFCGKPHISRSIFLYFRYQAWLKSW